MFLPYQRLESGIRMYSDVEAVQYLQFSGNFHKVGLKSACKG